MENIKEVIQALAGFTGAEPIDVEQFLKDGIGKYKKIRLIREKDELFKPFEERCKKYIPGLIEYYKYINIEVWPIVPVIDERGLYVEFKDTGKRVLAVSEDALGDDYERFLGWLNTEKYISGYVLSVLAEHKNLSIPELLTEIETWIANNPAQNE